MPVRADTVTRWQTAAQAGATVQVDKHDPRAEPATAVSAAATLGQRAAAERAQDRRESMPSLNASQRSALAADGMQRAGFDQMPGSEPMTTTAASELLRRDARRSDADTTPAVFRQTAMGTADPSSDLSRFQVGGSVADEGWSTAARSVAEQVSYYIFQGAQRAEVSLQGPDGGLIDVRIDLRGNEASIHFGTSDPETAHMLEASGLHLKEILHRQGLALSEVSVNMSDHSGTGAGRQTGGHVPQSSGVPRRPTATDQASPIAVVVERRGSDAAVDEYV